MSTEVELKLVVALADLPKVRRALFDLAPLSVAKSFLTTTYYDTDERALSRHGLSLRVRAADGRFVQTVKANAEIESNVLSRSEWEDEIASPLRDLRAPTSGCRLPREIADKLKPLFATAVKRTTMRLEPSASLSIEAAIDTGEIRGLGSGAIMPINEIELIEAGRSQRPV